MTLTNSTGNIIHSTRPLVTAFYTSTTSIANGGTYVYDTKLFDVNNNYSTSTGIFTAPVAGKYLVMVGGAHNVNSTSGSGAMRINDVAAGTTWDIPMAGPYFTTGASLIAAGYGGVIFSLAASSTVKVTANFVTWTTYQAIGGSNPELTWMSIIQVD